MFMRVLFFRSNTHALTRTTQKFNSRATLNTGARRLCMQTWPTLLIGTHDNMLVNIYPRLRGERSLSSPTVCAKNMD